MIFKKVTNGIDFIWLLHAAMILLSLSSVAMASKYWCGEVDAVSMIGMSIVLHSFLVLLLLWCLIPTERYSRYSRAFWINISFLCYLFLGLIVSVLASVSSNSSGISNEKLHEQYSIPGFVLMFLQLVLSLVVVAKSWRVCRAS